MHGKRKLTLILPLLWDDILQKRKNVIHVFGIPHYSTISSSLVVFSVFKTCFQHVEIAERIAGGAG